MWTTVLIGTCLLFDVSNCKIIRGNRVEGLFLSQDEFTFAEQCVQPNLICPSTCDNGTIAPVCMFKGTIKKTIKNMCEYVRIMNCCPMYSTQNGWTAAFCHPDKPPNDNDKPSCQNEMCAKGNPICASDGTSFVTFMSQCLFEKSRRCEERYENFSLFGEFDCKWILGDKSMCRERCETTLEVPICASNRYSIAYFLNKCEMIKAKKCCQTFDDLIATSTERCIKSGLTAINATECVKPNYSPYYLAGF